MGSSMPIRLRSRRSRTTRRQRRTWWTRSDWTTALMIDAQPRAGPSWIEGRPVLLRRQTLVFGAMAVAAALLATAPLAGLIVLAFGETGDLWSHLTRYVIPTALVKTA